MNTLRLYDGRRGRGGVTSQNVPMNLARCPVMTVSDAGSRGGGYYDQCSRKLKPGTRRPVFDVHQLKTFDLEVCGIHAGVYDRAEKKAATEEREKEVAADGVRQMDEMAAEISDRMGGLAVKADTYVDARNFLSKVTGKVRIDARELLAWLEGRTDE